MSQYNWKNITKADFLEAAILKNIQLNQEDLEYLQDWYSLSPEEKNAKFEVQYSLDAGEPEPRSYLRKRGPKALNSADPFYA